jgi:hypothetical protein
MHTYSPHRFETGIAERSTPILRETDGQLVFAIKK